MTDDWAAVREQTLDLAARLASLGEADWNSASLCAGWRVRDVLAHVVAGAQGAFGVRAVVGGLVRHRFDYNAWIAADGQRRGALDPSLILNAFRGTADEYGSSSAGSPIRSLTHVLVHGQDICRPLGIKRDLAEGHLVLVADFVATSFIFRAKKHTSGLTLTATDVEWSRGTGPGVSGPAEALVMVMAGRMSAVDDLSGEGLHRLRTAVGS